MRTFLAQKKKWISDRLYFQVVWGITPALHNRLIRLRCYPPEAHTAHTGSNRQNDVIHVVCMPKYKQETR